jgi:hypothetical protein
MRRIAVIAGLCGPWLCASGPAPAAEPPRLPHDLTDLVAPELRDIPPSLAIDTAAAAQRSMRSGSYLSIDLGVAADSNITNQTGLHAIDVIFDGETVPIELDPAFRERRGVGQALAVSGGARLPVSGKVAAALDADAQAANYDGAIADDISLLLAFGPEVTFDGSSQGAVQAFAFQRWYGGVVAGRGFGVRGRYQQPFGEGRLYLYVDARVLESDYGEDFEGKQGNLYLTYEALIEPWLSLSGTVYGRREGLGSDAFSNWDFGVYGGPSAFLPLGLKGGATLGLSRVLFDGPLVFYSPDARRDWRYAGTVWLMPRKPVGPGLWPSLSYSYTRTDSTLQFYRTDRHRLRLGVARYW